MLLITALTNDHLIGQLYLITEVSNHDQYTIAVVSCTKHSSTAANVDSSKVGSCPVQGSIKLLYYIEQNSAQLSDENLDEVNANHVEIERIGSRNGR